jgi:hypothetical protein
MSCQGATRAHAPGACHIRHAAALHFDRSKWSQWTPLSVINNHRPATPDRSDAAMDANHRHACGMPVSYSPRSHAAPAHEASGLPQAAQNFR